jgi:hypothetical protein
MGGCSVVQAVCASEARYPLAFRDDKDMMSIDIRYRLENHSHVADAIVPCYFGRVDDIIWR